MIISTFANHEPESRDSEASSDTIFILAFSIIMLNTDLLAASECSHLRSFNQQHATIWPCFCHILSLRADFTARHNPGVKKKMCLEEFVRLPLRCLNFFQLFFCSFLFFSIEHEHYIIILHICDYLHEFHYFRIQRFSPRAVCIWCIWSKATTVVSMVERSKQDGGAGWLADSDLEDGRSFCNMFLWYLIATLEL